jgi:hypothetical protein
MPGVAFLYRPLDFMTRLAALVPTPRVHLTRFHGVFAPHSRWRAQITPGKRGSGGPVRVIACIEDPLVIGKILEHLDRTSAAPRCAAGGVRCEKVVQRGRFRGAWSTAGARSRQAGVSSGTTGAEPVVRSGL